MLHPSHILLHNTACFGLKFRSVHASPSLQHAAVVTHVGYPQVAVSLEMMFLLLLLDLCSQAWLSSSQAWQTWLEDNHA